MSNWQKAGGHSRSSFQQLRKGAQFLLVSLRRMLRRARTFIEQYGESTGTVELKPLGRLTHKSIREDGSASSASGRLVSIDAEFLSEQGFLGPDEEAKHVTDQYRIIKRPILKLAFGETAARPKFSNLVMVASALPGDGKTFNAINIALSIANETDVSVLLVDADVAKPHMSELFGIADEPGFVDLLREGKTDWEAACIGTDVPRLSVLPAGRVYEYATELLASQKMEEALRTLSTQVPNRVVVFDSPPLLQTSESRVLAGRMGQIALVVCADKTPRPAVMAAIESLDAEQPINLILNRAGFMFGAGAYGAYPYGYGRTTA